MLTPHLYGLCGPHFYFNVQCIIFSENIITLNNINLTFIQALLNIFCTKFKSPIQTSLNRVFLQLKSFHYSYTCITRHYKTRSTNRDDWCQIHKHTLGAHYNGCRFFSHTAFQITLSDYANRPRSAKY